MAVPTFTSATPAYGPAGSRNMITIAGTNFRVPAASEDVQDVVRVEFDGIYAERVDILSTTSLAVVPPMYRGTGTAAKADPLAAVDIIITNLDDDGDPIGGESVTEIGGYTYKRAAIRDPDATLALQMYRQILNEVVETFRRQVTPNVAAGTNVDYGALGEIVILTSEHPSISIIGPRESENFEMRHLWEEGEASNDAPAEKSWPAELNDIEFDIVLASDSRREMLGMTQAVKQAFMRTVYIDIPQTFGDNNSDMHRFPLVLTTKLATSVQQPNSNLVVSPGVFEVRRIPYKLDDAIDIGLYDVLEGNLLVNQKDTSTANEETVTFADSD